MHSKGPWFRRDSVDEGGNIYHMWFDADGNELNLFGSDEAHGKANADLCAAAPLMLEALRAVLEIYDEPCRLDHHGLCQTHHLRRNDAGEPECEVELIRAAIAATEGRSE